MKRLARWPRLLARWIRILLGKSYYHQFQGLGKAFSSKELAGYFNDLTAKTQWLGDTDGEGIPVNVLANGRRVYFTTTVVQKALGHWDKWLLTGADREKEAFLKLCRWLLAWQDDRGGWPIWSELGLHFASPYSAMTQGEGISAFVRAWALTEDEVFFEGARKALGLMTKPVEDGGPSIYENEYLFLEEAPSCPRTSILNGWIFSLFGLYDYWLVFGDQEAKDFFWGSLAALKSHLDRYDVGYWSYYDVQGHLASPFYHDLHIHQLSALILVDRDPVLIEYRDRWIMYQRKRWNRAKALSVKAVQKLREPGEAVITR